MGFFRQEYCSGLPFPPLGDLPDPGIEPRSPTLQADSLPSEPPGNPKKNDLPSLSSNSGPSDYETDILPTALRGQTQTFPSLGDLHKPGIKPRSPALQTDSLPAELESESEVAQSCPTLFDPVGYSLPGSSLHEILQARILEWVTMSFSRGSSQPRD